MKNAIHLIGDFRREEAIASGTVKPGMWLDTTNQDKVRAHSTPGGYAERAIAVEDALQGKSINDIYADGALVEFNIVAPGCEVQSILKAGENVTIGTKLVSDGAGRLIAEDSVGSGVVVKQILAIAREAKNLSASGAVDALIAVRVL